MYNNKMYIYMYKGGGQGLPWVMLMQKDLEWASCSFWAKIRLVAGIFNSMIPKGETIALSNREDPKKRKREQSSDKIHKKIFNNLIS